MRCDFNPVSYHRFQNMGTRVYWAGKREKLKEVGIEPVKPSETIRATVIGAGTHSVNLSGSTISVRDESLPLKNVSAISPLRKIC